MRDKSIIRGNKGIIFISLFLMLVISIRAFLIAVPTVVEGVNLKEFSESRTLTTQILPASRGTIFDRNGEILAIDVASYTVIAYLEESRTDNPDKPNHVIDVQMTAEKLAPVIGMEVERLYELMSKDAYQVELGPGGRGITELKKEEIEALNLYGIDFMAAYKRYYPKGIFASYMIGYAKNDAEGNIVGELGVEIEYDDELSGINGYKEYQRDRLGYQIPGTPYIEEQPVNGYDVYLTLDYNIQLFVEKALLNNYEKYGGDWITMTVADGKTGEILASSIYPTFDPNKRDVEVYLDPLVSYSYEPGSTMKIWTYMAIMENNMYDGDATYKSGIMNYETGEKIRDWNNGVGWGTITYDEGFGHSSNVGVANLTSKYINGADLKAYYEKVGFGSKTGVHLPREYSGELGFKYLFDTATAGFGQGIKTTQIQTIKALTAISNNGNLLNPYVIKQVSKGDEIIYVGETEVVDNVASLSTVTKIKKLMYDVVNGDSSLNTGTRYAIKGHDIIGKTGTAQIAKENGTGYYSSSYGSIYSFAGMFPYDNPEVVIYTSVRRSNAGKTPIVDATREVIKDVATYLNIYEDIDEKIDLTYYNMPSVVNKGVTEATIDFIDNQLIIIGDGNTIIRQYPKADEKISSIEKVFLLTNNTEIKMPNMKNWAYKDVYNYFSLINIDFTYSGIGYVSSQNIKAGTVLTQKTKPELIFISEIK